MQLSIITNFRTRCHSPHQEVYSARIESRELCRRLAVMATKVNIRGLSNCRLDVKIRHPMMSIELPDWNSMVRPRAIWFEVRYWLGACRTSMHVPQSSIRKMSAQIPIVRLREGQLKVITSCKFQSWHPCPLIIHKTRQSMILETNKDRK